MRGKIIVGAAAILGAGVGSYALAQSDEAAPDLAACELHIRSGLPAGVGYRRVAVTRDDTAPLTFTQFQQQAGVSASVHGLGEAEELRDLADGLAAKAGRLSLRRMMLTYQVGGEAQPRQQICAFRLSDGKLQSAETLNDAATSSTAKALDALADLKRRPRQSRPKHSCCL
ncbi:hypothetical protein [uncultured Sphingomonas sp.]|uniref:hypothetical protein n=1 Tax=uncultured Sphingomonas sp. TaxID=158754 RepID=UPI0037485BC2